MFCIYIDLECILYCIVLYQVVLYKYNIKNNMSIGFIIPGKDWSTQYDHWTPELAKDGPTTSVHRLREREKPDPAACQSGSLCTDQPFYPLLIVVAIDEMGQYVGPQNMDIDWIYV